MTAGKIGTLLRISGQVVRTHPVHPELVLGHFRCVECQGEVPAVEQQFKYTQVNRWEGVLWCGRRCAVMCWERGDFMSFPPLSCGLLFYTRRWVLSDRP